MTNDSFQTPAAGHTLEARALLVLRTRGGRLETLRAAYRKAAKRYHPDKQGGDKTKFQVVNEAYAFLVRGVLPKRPLLANDMLVAEMVGKTVAPLSARPAKTGYEQWHWDQFYWDW